MLGRLNYDAGRWGRAERETLYGIPVWQALADPEGKLGNYRIRRAGRSLSRQGIQRVLVPRTFAQWDILAGCGLSQVDPIPFIRAQSAALAVEALVRRGVSPDRASVALRGKRADREMRQTAIRLCGQVRRLVIEADRGGEELADWLRWEFGIPVLPREETAEVALQFCPQGVGGDELALKLYGPAPDLAGMSLTAPDLKEEDSADLPLLAALWEGGRLTETRLKIT